MDELSLITLAAAKSYTDEHGGGGGGTSNYNDLSNKPQIGGVTLSGNKSASDLGLVSAEAGKGLSSNDYTNEDKAIVGGVTAALAGKQGALTAGNNIKIDDDTISVNRWAVPAGKVVYTVITSDENYGQNVHVQRHTTGGAFIDDRTFLCEMYKTVDVDGLISIQNPYASFNITLLKDSDEQQAGYRYTVNPITTPTSNSFTFTMEQEENDNDLIIRSELDAEVGAIKDGQSIDSFADVETALALKQDKTDNNLQTTDKTVVGAINEHEGDIDSLKSGLTNVDVALDVPNGTGKNRLTITATTTTTNGVTFTVNDDGTVTLNGKTTATDTNFTIFNPWTFVGNYILNGVPESAPSGTKLQAFMAGKIAEDTGSGVALNVVSGDTYRIRIVITGTGIVFNNVTIKPMLRLASVSDPTFSPYIPSVESRIEAVESNLTGNWRQVTFADVFTFAQDVTASLGQNCVAWVRGDRVRIKLFVSGSITTTSTGYKTIGNVSNNYRPANNTIMPGFVNSRSDGTQMLASASYAINTNGNINLLYGDTATLGSVGSDWLGGNSILFEWSIK